MRIAPERNRAAETLRILNEAAVAFNAALPNLDVLLNTVSRFTVEHVGEIGVVSLLSQDGKWLVPKAGYHAHPQHRGLMQRLLNAALIPADDNVHRRRTLRAPAVAFCGLEEPPTRGQTECTEVAVSLDGIAAPLYAGDEVIGALLSYRPTSVSPHGPEAIALLRGIADRAAPVIGIGLLHQQLVALEQRLASMVDQIVVAQESERRRVAYDIHDGLAQLAASTYHYLEAYAGHHQGTLAEQEELFRTRALARRTIQEARRVIADLRPTILDNFGLQAALREELRGLRELGFAISFEDASGDDSLPRPIEVALFRIAQEALTNIRKHAGPTPVRVSLEREGNWLRLEVQDFGRGFDTSSPAPQTGPGERVGLEGIHERVALLNGRCRITSQPGAGTWIVVELPLETEKGGSAHVSQNESGSERPIRLGGDR